jgi:hypothetical protein
MEYAITAAFLLAVVAGSFAAVILGGYGVAQLIASARRLDEGSRAWLGRAGTKHGAGPGAADGVLRTAFAPGVSWGRNFSARITLLQCARLHRKGFH